MILKNDSNIYRPEFVKDLFNKMSHTYERMNYITSFGFSIRWRRQSLDFFKKSNEQVQVLDLMCGMGETWDFIINRFPNSTITAADFSTEMLKKAETKNQKKFGGNVELINEDFLKNNLPSNYYDYVICAYGLKTFNEEQLNFLAAEVNRILKPGGYFSFIEVSKPGNSFLNGFYQFYLKNVIPILGKLFLGNPEQYKMLWHYTENFENANQSYLIFLKNVYKQIMSNIFTVALREYSEVNKIKMSRFLMVLVVLFVSCDEQSKKNYIQEKPIVIQIQPFSDMKKEEVDLIAKEISKVYPYLEILKPTDFPENTYYEPRNRYRADSIIKFLSSETKTGFVKLGLTSKDISVTKGKNPDFGVMGLGYRPGKACVASTFRLNNNNKNSQFYKVAIHELGHTQGLPHCPEKTCFMRDAEGGNPTDELKEFCKKCKNHLKSKNWKLI